MLKKIFSIVLCLMVILHFSVYIKTPIFSRFSNDIEVYLGDNSSLCKIQKVNNLEYKFLSKIKGEAVIISAEDFNLSEFLEYYDAKIEFVENLNGTSIYAYSNKIPYRAKLNGKMINLHVFLGERIKVGSPLIFGSF